MLENPFDFLRGRLLTGMLLAYLCGILLAHFVPFSLLVAVILLAAFLLCLGINFLCPFDLRPLLLLTVMALGIFFYTAQRDMLAAWPLDDGEEVQMTGIVKGSPERLEDDRYRLLLKPKTVAGEEIHCALVYVYGKGAPPKAGSLLAVEGQVYQPYVYGNANRFDYNDYLAKQGVAAMVSTEYSGGIWLLKDGPAWNPGNLSFWLESLLEEAGSELTPRQEALLRGVFLGDKSGLDYEMKDTLGVMGLLHVFAVSGLHVGFLVTGIWVLIGKRYERRWIRLLLICFMLVLYVGMTGYRPSMLRAALMAAIVLLGSCLDELYDPVTGISCAAFVCLLWQPMWLFDAGFQLSFCAVWGLMLYEPLFRRLFPFLPDFLRQGFSSSLAASLFLMPLLSYYFYRITWLGWLISPVAVGIAALNVLLCFLSLPMSLLCPFLAKYLLLIPAYLLDLLYQFSFFLSQLPFSSTNVSAISPLAVLGYMTLLAFLPWGLRQIKGKVGQVLVPVSLFGLMLLFSFLPGEVEPGGRSETLAEVVFLDVGQGDAALLLTEDGEAVLIDGGGTSSTGAIGEYVLLPYLQSRGITELDAIISSHPDQDHIDGLLTVLSHMPVKRVYYAEAAAENELQEKLLMFSEAQGVSPYPLEAGDTFSLGDILTFEVWGPKADAWYAEDNDLSLVLTVSAGDTEILFTGDASGNVLREYASTGDLSADIVKLPHHGSDTGYDEAFYAAVNSEDAIFSVGADNSYGHPKEIVLEYWQQHGEVWRTDTMGAITVQIEETGYTVLTEKDLYAESGT